MDLGDIDTQQKIDELERLLAGDDAAALFDAGIRARIAGEFRDCDGMIGLPLPDPELVAKMKQLSNDALDRAAELGNIEAGVDAANRIYFARRADRAATALAYLERAPDDPRALYLLGLCYGAAFGVPKDEAKSLDQHERAARAGSADAMFELYVYYAKGIGTAVDNARAVDWCRQAAEAGSSRAMANLGGFYATGNGVEQDGAQAIAWYTKAADAGSGRAAATLGVMYALGDSVEADDEKAKQFFRQAGALGFPWWDMADQCGLDPDDYE